METWLAFTENGTVPCGTLHYVRMDGRWGIARLHIEASALLEKHCKLYDGAIVYRGRITDYDKPSRVLFSL